MAGLPDRQSSDVVVIGAGPTGLTLANLLGGMGVRTILIEKNDDTVQEPRAVSIDDESMRTMQAAKLEAEVGAITARGYGSVYRSPSGRVFAEVMPTDKEYGFDKRNAFQQPELEAVLRRGLVRHDAVDAYFSSEMTSFEDASDRVIVRYMMAGQEREIETKFLVGADGARSGTRKALGVALEGGTFEEPWLIVDLVQTFNRFRHTEVNCDPRRPCISLPGPDGIRRYEFMLHPHEDRVAATNESFVRDLMAQVGPDRDAPIKRIRVYTFHARLAEKWRVGRVFLAGDAAHLTPPFAGQGMNSGIRDAHNLAWKLSEAVACEDAHALLDSYEVERKPHARAMIDLALRMGQIMMPRSPVQAAVVRAGFRLLGLYPPARDYVAQMRYKPKPRFARGLVWPSPGGDALGVSGGMIPQPEVETPDRSRLLLDNFLPDTPVVLVLSRSPEAAVPPELVRRFSDAGANILGIAPGDTNPIRAEIPIARDVTGSLSTGRFAGCIEHALLLRRDRYIAAVRPIDRIEDLLPLVRRLSPARAASNSNCDAKLSK